MTSVAIVGGGMSGIALAHMLTKEGIDRFVIYEKADEFGGTWRDNTYPGLRCDVASRYYSFAFQPNPQWSEYFATGPEIQRYLLDVAAREGLRRHARLSTEVVGARWIDGRWSLSLDDGTTEEADVLVSACGSLHRPAVPQLPGADRFEGRILHSSAWTEDVQTAGKDVVVVGTGSSGVQIVSALAESAHGVVHVQRSPQWIFPGKNRPYANWVPRLWSRFPVLNRWSYRAWGSLFEGMSRASLQDGWQRRAIRRVCERHLRSIEDTELRRRLTPDYQPGCKRLVISDRYYRVVQQPNVDVVAGTIDEVGNRSVVVGGTTYPADVIVLATGFEFLRPIDNVVGSDGRSLTDHWASKPTTFNTIAVAGFPNFFLVNGPPFVVTATTIKVAELQAACIARLVRQASDRGLGPIVPSEAAQDRHNQELQDELPGTIYATGCDNYYLTPSGSPNVLPWSAKRLTSTLASLCVNDFEAVSRSQAREEAPAPAPR